MKLPAWSVPSHHSQVLLVAACGLDVAIHLHARLHIFAQRIHRPLREGTRGPQKIRMRVPGDVRKKLFRATGVVANLAVPVHDNQIDAASLCKVSHHLCRHAHFLKMLPVKGRGVFEFFP